MDVIPDGWMLVPKEPTSEMIDAFLIAYIGARARKGFVRTDEELEALVSAACQAMLAAAPKNKCEAIEALHYLMQQFDGEFWNCPQCGHVEGTNDTDSAIWLRDWLKTHNATLSGPRADEGKSDAGPRSA